MAAAFLHEADFPPYFGLIAFTHKFCSLHPTAIGREHHDGKITRQLQDRLTKSLRIEIDDVAAECILEGRDIVMSCATKHSVPTVSKSYVAVGSRGFVCRFLRAHARCSATLVTRAASFSGSVSI